jgi:3-keto-disaccharide hydrolase
LLISAGAGAADDGFTPLFNGKDLTGWVPVQVAPTTFTVRDGMIVCTGVPTGVMRTDRQYENFVLELDYMHLVPGGNSGLFIWSDPITAVGQPFTRAIEVQILDGRTNENYTSHGDVFSIHGARMKPDRPHPGGWERCLPSEHRANPAGQWNHYRVECNDGALKLSVNGKEVSGGHTIHPRKGYICLESEGGTVHFKNIRIRELPSTNPRPADVAAVDEGFKSMYTGVDLAGWRDEAGHKGHWQPKDWTLVYDGKSEAKDKTLWTEKEFGDFVMIVDWRVPKDAPGAGSRGGGISLRGSSEPVVRIAPAPPGGDSAATATPRAERAPGSWNRLVITVKGDTCTAVLNGQTVMDNARLRGVPSRGRIGLQYPGNPIEFANLYIRELK